MIAGNLAYVIADFYDKQRSFLLLLIGGLEFGSKKIKCKLDFMSRMIRNGRYVAQYIDECDHPIVKKLYVLKM